MGRIGWLAAGAVVNGVAGATAAGTVGAVATAPSAAPDERLPIALRATGNGTFVVFALPFLMRARADERRFWAYAGAHATHLTCLACTARRHRRDAGSFSATSRYGGALGYATIAALGATSYSPGGLPYSDRRVRRLHHAGERILFGLYAFTIGHGFLAKGRNGRVYGPLAALWLAAAISGRRRWTRAWWS